jgi:hypothetical protein
VEAALRQLRAAGVYVTFEGSRAAARSSGTAWLADVRPEDWDNPSFRRYFSVATGGSTGVPRRVLMDLDYFESRLPSQVVMEEAHGLLGVRHVQWAEIPPGHGLESVLLRVPLGFPPERWFTPVWAGPDSQVGASARRPAWPGRRARRGRNRALAGYLPFDRLM